MRIDRRLNLVIPVDRDDGTRVYVHSTPVSEDVFDRHFLLMSRTFAAIVATGMGEIAGPRVALKMLRRMAGQMKADDEAEALVNEIRRTSTFLSPGADGYDIVTLHEALERDLMDRTDASEVENAVAFFTVYSAMQRRRDLAETLDGLAELWGARTSSLNSTEYAASMRTPTPVASTGGTATPSSIPS